MCLQYRRKFFDVEVIQGKCVVFNTESAYWYLTCKNYKKYVDSCDNIFIDGIGIALKIHGYQGFSRRYHGPDLLHDVLNFSQSSSVKLVLLGGPTLEPKVLKNLNIDAQIILPYSDSVETLFEHTIQHEQTLKNSTLLISLGLPKQELLAFKLSRQMDTLKLNSIIPIGAAIDFAVGSKRRSGYFWRLVGLEWLPRLIREPRMFKRVINSVKGLYLFKSDCITK
jgi:N-acetylglucosaminyldiphosphoundecaprenol N-acetyl-beta-D-mannosaminyltransferase